MGVRRKTDERDSELEQDTDVDDLEDETPDAEVTEGIPQATQKVAAFLEKVRNSPEIEGAVVLDLTRKGEASQRNVFRIRYHLDDAQRMAKDILAKVEERIENAYGRIEITVRVMQHPEFVMQFLLRRPQPQSVNGQLGDNIYGSEEIAVALMDHSQVQMRMLLQKAQADDSGLRTDLRDARGRIRELESNITHYLSLIGKLTRMEWLVESEREDKKLRRERSEQLFKMGVPLAMAMFAKLTGENMAPMLGMLAGGAVAPAGPGGPPPSPYGPPPGMGSPTEGTYPSYSAPPVPPQPQATGPTAIETCVGELFASLTQEQFSKIAMSPDLFKPDQVVLLMQIGDLLAKKKREWAEASESSAAAPSVQRATTDATEKKVHEGDFDEEPWTGGFTFTPRAT